jgi:ubiquinone/menaquinone biosynthesis C-methylase UbiE
MLVTIESGGRVSSQLIAPRFEDITETTGTQVTGEAARMLYTRYATAAEHAKGRRVLELACGSGQGFGLVAAGARSLIGGDFSMPLLRSARAQYERRVPLTRLSAERLPFRDGAFDLVLFFEATYYVAKMDAAFDEVARVLRPEGVVLFVNANPERTDFIRSPHSIHYHTADEFRIALERRGFKVTTQGGFAVQDSRGLNARIVGFALTTARRILRALGLVPATLRGRARLKRLVYGPNLTRVPAEISQDFASAAPLTPLTPGPVRRYKVIYVRGNRGGRHVTR